MPSSSLPKSEFRFTFRCADCGVIAHGFSRPPELEESPLNVEQMLPLPPRWEAQRLAAVAAAFVSCPACQGRARAGLLRVGYWYARLLLAVACRALGFAALAYLLLPVLPEHWIQPTTGGAALAVATLFGLLWAGGAGSKYVTAMRSAEGCVRYD